MMHFCHTCFSWTGYSSHNFHLWSICVFTNVSYGTQRPLWHLNSYRLHQCQLWNPASSLAFEFLQTSPMSVVEPSVLSGIWILTDFTNVSCGTQRPLWHLNSYRLHQCQLWNPASSLAFEFLQTSPMSVVEPSVLSGIWILTDFTNVSCGTQHPLWHLNSYRLHQCQLWNPASSLAFEFLQTSPMSVVEPSILSGIWILTDFTNVSCGTQRPLWHLNSCRLHQCQFWNPASSLAFEFLQTSPVSVVEPSILSGIWILTDFTNVSCGTQHPLWHLNSYRLHQCQLWNPASSLAFEFLQTSPVSVVEPSVLSGIWILTDFTSVSCGTQHPLWHLNSYRLHQCQLWNPASSLAFEFLQTSVYTFDRFIYHLGPVKRICVFEHSVMTNFNCACPDIQRG